MSAASSEAGGWQDAWAYPNMWEAICAVQPDVPIIIQDGRTLTYGQFDAAADALAQHMRDAGLQHQSKVAIYTPNRAEYLVAFYAAFKAGLTPSNVNYRYAANEVVQLLDNGDAEAVVFDAAYLPIVLEARPRALAVRTWVAIAGDGGSLPEWIADYAEITAQAPARRPVVASWGRSADDIMLLFTGGTTGAPKGVMWRQGDMIGRFGYGANPALGLGPLARPADAGARVAEHPSSFRSLVACPLMHGTGLISSLSVIGMGGTIVLLPPGSFDAELLWDTVERERANRVTIVGQAFAQPMLAALDAHPGRWDLGSLTLIGSSGTMWSRENKQGLLRHLPDIQLSDSFSSSEAFGMAQSITTRDGESATGSFSLTPTCAVFTEDGRRVAPGSDERGRIAIGGHIPLGYYKDPAKSAETFPIYEGARWSVPGDWATVSADGDIVVLGRGSQCINTGGEKVFPEEVEEALKTHAAVIDAAVTGVPDPRFGERIVALVRLEDSASASEDDLREHVRTALATYKAPRHVFAVTAIDRLANGKLNYPAVKAVAQSRLADQGVQLS
ncbi:MAG: AMP-binding protein [Sphingomonas sp.]|uniref:AMP-binding protein n=1 Tax=Sphingomonas sp. TaxID=28214 RepID=UPI001ACE66BC|nr:AMP-binding protein [Sphingomonas sp.]MBN8814352.1 AMP-binding protein [Sphingomonas sp.]